MANRLKHLAARRKIEFPNVAQSWKYHTYYFVEYSGKWIAYCALKPSLGFKDMPVRLSKPGLRKRQFDDRR
jgi:hypothetical protein